MKPSIVSLAIIFAFLQYKLWIEEGSFQSLFLLKSSLAVEKTRLDEMDLRNHQLISKINRLKSDKSEIEAFARSELSMVGSSETFYQVIEH